MFSLHEVYTTNKLALILFLLTVSASWKYGNCFNLLNLHAKDKTFLKHTFKVRQLGGTTVRTSNSCTKCVGSPGITNTRPHSWLSPSFLGMNTSWMTSPATWVINVIGIFFWHVTTRHWQMSGRAVQELNVFTVWLWILSHFHCGNEQHAHQSTSIF